MLQTEISGKLGTKLYFCLNIITLSVFQVKSVLTLWQSTTRAAKFWTDYSFLTLRLPVFDQQAVVPCLQRQLEASFPRGIRGRKEKIAGAINGVNWCFHQKRFAIEFPDDNNYQALFIFVFAFLFQFIIFHRCN